MKLSQIKLENFRCYKNETIIDIDDLTILIGKNDSGKSTVLDALDIFFDDKKCPDKDDACVHGDEARVKITCVFRNYPSELILDATYPTTLRDEYLLNENNLLEIMKIYDCSGSKGKIKGTYAHARHPTGENYNDLLALTNTKLKQRARDLGVDLGQCDQTINTLLRRAIWSQESNLNLQGTDVELKSETTGRVWEQLKKHLPIYALFKSDRASTDQDSEAQDPLKAAIKEAIQSQENQLNTIA